MENRYKAIVKAVEKTGLSSLRHAQVDQLASPRMYPTKRRLAPELTQIQGQENGKRAPEEEFKITENEASLDTIITIAFPFVYHSPSCHLVRS